MKNQFVPYDIALKLKELGFLKSDIKAEKKSSLDEVSFGLLGEFD